MLKKISDAFSGQGPLSQWLCDFDKMLELAGQMLVLTNPQTLTAADLEQTYDTIYACDKQINALERHIRREILQHLSAHQGQDAGICMVMMVVCKDAERVGDYCKNIFEVALYCGPSRYASAHVGEFQNIREQLDFTIPTVRRAFSRADVVAAHQVFEWAGAVAKQADFIVQQILEGSNPEAKEPVAQVLLARHYKRIGAHLSNICTAVTSPVEMLGYYDENRLKP